MAGPWVSPTAGCHGCSFSSDVPPQVPLPCDRDPVTGRGAPLSIRVGGVGGSQKGSTFDVTLHLERGL